MLRSKVCLAPLEKRLVLLKKKEADLSPPPIKGSPQQNIWYLGLDIGAIALSATLFNSATRKQHPLYWTSTHPKLNLAQAYQLTFTDYLMAKTDRGHQATIETLNFQSDEERPLQQFYTRPLFRRLKTYLNTTVPFLSPDSREWEPKIQVSDTTELPLVTVRFFLTTVLKSLISDPFGPVSCGADGLTSDAVRVALENLAGMIVNRPIGVSEAYQFNVREAILEAGLIHDAAKIYFVEAAIAALLAERHPPGQASTQQGGVLVVSAGTSITEVVLANIPGDLQPLSRHDLALRRIAYAGDTLDQDIICQLLYPRAQGWESLKLETLDLPLPGEPDLEARFRLQQRLENVPLGQTLLKVVRQMKPLFQQDLSFKVGDNEWTLSQQDLHNWVITPYLQQLNRELNGLLTQCGMTTQAVKTILCTGGMMTIPAIADWLQQKFPKAIVIRDTLANQGTTSSQRVANGLAVLPQYPFILDAMHHQYSEFLLLREVLKILPTQTEQPYTSTQLVNLLEDEGIPAKICEPFVKNLLEGQLPIGLVMTKVDAVLLSSDLSQPANSERFTDASLFTRQGGPLYRLNQVQRDRLWNHLQNILAITHQTLEAALPIPFEPTLNALVKER